jgi:radical SAM superfamily enzyme YgiQ (UPF0313 family)
MNDIKKMPKVYIADLRHTAAGIANYCMPLGIGYMKAVMDIKLPDIDSQTFVYPDLLLEAMKSNPPDVLFLSNYVWNEALSRHFSSLAKRINRNTLVVAGGPNIPVEDKRQIEFFKSWKNIDAYALGEGDFLVTEIVSLFLDANKSIQKLTSKGIPSCVHMFEGEILLQPVWDRELKLGDIPSPWLNGTQDHFFDGKLIPLIETNRGCPFKCSFCVQGEEYYKRISHFEEDQVKEELSYIVRRIKNVCPNMGSLTIADPNFGMYKRDLDIATHIGTLQESYGWPSYMDCSTGKNAPELIIKCIEKTNGALSMSRAVQSLDVDVLKNIKRSNIKLDTYAKVSEHLKVKGIPTSSQTILGLPGETLESHLSGLSELLNEGIDRLQNFQLMLLKGSEIESYHSRKNFKFQTKFRLSPSSFGKYDGEQIFDVEEIVVATDTLSFSDYLYARKYHLVLIVYWSQNWFNHLFYFAQNLGIKKSTLIEEIFNLMGSGKGTVHKIMQDFEDETKGELFSTAEECFKYYSENNRFEKLVSGEIGENLLNKYRAIASFLIWPEVCNLAKKAISRLVLANRFCGLETEFELFIEDLFKYIELKHASGQSVSEITLPASFRFKYDIPKWINDGHSINPAPYKFKKEETFLFKLPINRAKEIGDAINTWSTEIRGLAKAARYLKVTSQERECLKDSRVGKSENFTSG